MFCGADVACHVGNRWAAVHVAGLGFRYWHPTPYHQVTSRNRRAAKPKARVCVLRVSGVSSHLILAIEGQNYGLSRVQRFKTNKPVQRGATLVATA